jgi:hypothetical protein
VVGFDDTSGLVSLRGRCRHDRPCLLIERDTHDFARLNRAITTLTRRLQQSGPPVLFPKEGLKKLTSGASWRRHDQHSWLPCYTKSVWMVEKWLQSTLNASTNTNNDEYTEHERQRQQFVDDVLYKAERQSRARRRASERHARHFQQYFTRTTNIARMVRLACARCEAASAATAAQGVVFVEPSCGDGRILHALLQRLQQQSSENHQTGEVRVVSLVGCELDPVMANAARLSLDAVGVHMDSSTDSTIGCDNDNENDTIDGHHRPPFLSMRVITGDYLQTTRNSVVSADCSRRPHVVVVGNPPFSAIDAKDEYGFDGDEGTKDDHKDESDDNDVLVTTTNNNSDDLPLQFLLHSALELLADDIVLLLPDRCASESFVQTAVENLRDRWALIDCHSAESDFDLGDRIIKQPVVIQVWTKRVLPMEKD